MRRAAIAIKVVAITGGLVGLHSANAADFSVGAGTLMTPTAADSWYCSQPSGCTASGTRDLWTSNYPVEIAAQASALHNNVDLIYEYIRNNIEYIPIYGLQKGAIGALIDRSGTAFDQAQLMVEMLRAAGYTANYISGTITLTGSQVNGLLGVTSASALRSILADGGIPATVTPTSGTVTSVTMAHMWVQVNVGGTLYVFDPAFKTHTFTASINIANASGWDETAFLTAAQSGMVSGTQSARPAVNINTTVNVPFVSNVNVAGVKSQLDSYATTLMNYLRANGYATKQIEDVVGRQDIVPDVAGPIRQTSLAYQASADHTWSGNIPDVYRTKLKVELLQLNTTTVLLSQNLFADEVYGRRVSYDPFATANVWSNSSVRLRVDNIDVGQLYVGTELPNNRTAQVRLTVDHPYVSNSGAYMDSVDTKFVDLISPVIVVLGFGDVSDRLQARLGKEQALDKLLPSSAYFKCGAGGCENIDRPDQPAGETGLIRAYSGWLSQYTRMSMLQSRMLPAIHQRHHSVGVAYRQSFMTVTQPKASPESACGMCWSVGQGATVLDIDTAVSVNSKTGSAANRKALSLSLSAAADTLEGMQFEESGSATPASVAHRFDWGTNNSASMRYYLLTQSTNSVDLFPNGPLPYFYASIFAPLQAYTDVGFKVIAAQNEFMGPGRSCNPPEPSGCAGSAGSQQVIYLERGGAFQAFGANGVSSAEVVTNARGFSFNGGSAGSPPSYDETYSPDKAADLLKDQFKDRSRDFGVDLANGEFMYSSSDLSVGLGDFPYKLSFERTFKSGESHSPGMGKGWSHNLDIRANLSTSGSETMGQSSVLPAASALMALFATQKIYATVPTTDDALLARWVVAPFVQSWWVEKIRFNVVTHTQGSASRVFVRLPDGTFNPPGAYNPNDGSSFWKLTQTGAPGGYGIKWGFGQVSFTLTSPSRDVQTFSYWGRPNRDMGQPHLYGPHHGWHVSSWSFPQGVSLSFNYVPVDLTTYVDDHLASVQNSLGRQINFSFAANSFWDVCNIQAVDDGQGHAASFDCANATVTSPSGDISKYVYGTADCQHGHGLCSPYLTDIFGPSDPSAPKVHLGYGPTGQVATYADAVSVKTPAARNPYKFYVTGTRGERQDPAGNLFTIYYDPWGRAISFTNELGNTAWAKYDGLGRVTKRTTAENIISDFTYEPRGQITQIKQTPKTTPYSVPASLTVKASYDPGCGKLASVTDAKNKITTMTHDPGTCLVSQVTQPTVLDGKTASNTAPITLYTYTSVGLADTITDPTGVVVKYTYDATGNRTLAQVDPNGLNVQKGFGYDSVGNITSTTTGRGNTTTFVYDNDRRVKQIIGPASTCSFSETIRQGGVVRKVRNAKVCNPDFITDNDWQVWLKDYTPTDKISLETDPDNGTTQTSYDAADRPEYVTLSVGGAAASRATRTQYDAAGQIYRTYKAWGTVDQITYAEYAYSADGRQISLKDANSNLTSLDYDGYGRLAKTIFPDSTFEQYAYDNNGNRTSKINRSGITITSAFDALNRETSRTIPDNPNFAGNYARTLTKKYDLASREWDIKADGQTLGDRYDTAGRLNAVNDSLLNSLGSGFGNVGYAYDPSGNRSSVTFTAAQGAWTAGYDYDAGERLWHITNSGLTLAQYSFDSMSRSTGITYMDTTSLAYGYEADDDLQALTNTFRGGNVGITFTHNGVHQIKSQSVSDTNYLMKEPGTAKTYVANNLNQYSQFGSSILAYDTNGNLIGDGVWTYSYDEENRLRRAIGNGTTVDYAYDPAGRRRSKTVNGVITYFISDGANELAELSSTGSRLRFYVNGSGMDTRVAMYDDTSLGWLFYHTNHQGSVLYTTRYATGGAVQDSYSYGAYGEATSTQPLTGNPFRYTGRYLDAETGLYYYRARYYSPTLGRFLQTDPIGYKEDLNLYSYVGNDPLDSTDPTGECPSCVGALTGVLLGAAIRGLTGGEIFDLKAIAVDAALGAVGAGIVGKGAALIQRARAGSGIARSAAIGRHGERAANIRGARETFQNAAGKTRVTDGGAGTSAVHEVKNVAEISNAAARQIGDEAGFASSQGRSLTLHVREGTDLTKVQGLIDSGGAEVRTLSNTAEDGFRKGLFNSEAAGVGSATGAACNATGGTGNTMCKK